MQMWIPLIAGIQACVFRGVVLSWSAGQWNHWTFWIYGGIYGGIVLVGAMLLDPGLRKERLRPAPGGHDRATIVITKYLYLIHMIMAGLDVGRYHWSDTISAQLSVVGLVLFGLAMAFCQYAMTTNKFFSPVIRIQDERDHKVISSGAYRLVRHPGYAGIILGVLSSPIALGSWVSGIPLILMAALIIRRTAMEDRFLHENLDGYKAYAERVRYRLVPLVW